MLKITFPLQTRYLVIQFHLKIYLKKVNFCACVLMCSCTSVELKKCAFCFESLQTFVEW